MQQFDKILILAQQKNIPSQELQIVLASFLSSAIRQATEELRLADKLSEPDFKEALDKITAIKDKVELKRFNEEFEKKFLPAETSFQRVVESYFVQLIDALIVKLEEE